MLKYVLNCQNRNGQKNLSTIQEFQYRDISSIAYRAPYCQYILSGTRNLKISLKKK